MNEYEETIYQRRTEDTRLLRIESTLSDITTKINNGLSSRSKETMTKVNDLSSALTEMDKTLTKNSVKGEFICNEMADIKTTIKSLAESQRTWIKLFNGVLITVLIGIFSTLWWAGMNLNDIDIIMDHIKTELDRSSDK